MLLPLMTRIKVILIKRRQHSLTSRLLDFMIAGQETTANALAYTTYLLSLNPDEQEQLCEAIDNYYQENEVSSTCTCTCI